MTNVLLYWNHICVLHNQEKAFLSRLAESLKAEDIALTVRYFGLGYPEHMSEYLAREDAVLPDLIVSADLEVFEDARLMEKLRPTLHQSRDFVPLADSAALSCCERGAALLPILAIPLVYFTREPERAERTPLCEMDGLCIGGVNNSAIKTVAKTLLSHAGQTQTERFLAHANVSDMPIGAYNQVRMGAQKTALVPVALCPPRGRKPDFSPRASGRPGADSQLFGRAHVDFPRFGAKAGQSHPLQSALRVLRPKWRSHPLPRLCRNAQQAGKQPLFRAPRGLAAKL